MSFKLSSTAVIFESAGSSILVCDSFSFVTLRPGFDSANSLDSNYISGYFPEVSFNSDLIPVPVAGSTATYMAGGYPRDLTLQKFSLASDTNGVDVGDLINPGLHNRNSTATSSPSEGFISGGLAYPAANTGSGPYSTTDINVIQKFPFASDTNITDAGDLVRTTVGSNGLSARTNGISFQFDVEYPYPQTQISKFPFATVSSSASSSAVLNAKGQKMGSVSITHGYTMGGKQVPPAGDNAFFAGRGPISASDPQ